jgi:hypothetical protein
MKKISVLYHSGCSHTINKANAISSGVQSVDDVTAKAIGTRVVTVVRDLLR